MRPQVCRNVVPAGWLVCPFQPAVNRLVTPNALVIDQHGWMYVPAPQLEYLSAHNRGDDKAQALWSVYRFRLPATKT
ncbi:MAG: hypothetical protein QRY16_15935 [Enterobacterales bacterium endosymbiont of Blomia tropicalis]|uniref:hypothetical protein n=1 Tax=Mixta mediterraneensis TaxID=2758443 RepID=UPI0025A87DA3|nr:hypothetical protein [Mixta mediterraneensis]MDL4915210.1 hypothetical protein [Mixta mediterraneensis]